jgi:hypothetical protein
MPADPASPSVIFARALIGQQPTPDQLATLDPAWAEALDAARQATPVNCRAALILARLGNTSLDRLIATLRGEPPQETSAAHASAQPAGLQYGHPHTSPPAALTLTVDAAPTLTVDLVSTALRNSLVKVGDFHLSPRAASFHLPSRARDPGTAHLSSRACDTGTTHLSSRSEARDLTLTSSTGRHESLAGAG